MSSRFTLEHISCQSLSRERRLVAQQTVRPLPCKWVGSSQGSTSHHMHGLQSPRGALETVTGQVALASPAFSYDGRPQTGGCLNMAQKPAWGTRPLSTRVQRWRVPGVRTPATLLHWSPERRPWHKSWAAAPTSRRAGSARGTDPSAVNVMARALCTREPTSSASNATERVLAHMSEDNRFR